MGWVRMGTQWNWKHGFSARQTARTTRIVTITMSPMPMAHAQETGTCKDTWDTSDSVKFGSPTASPLANRGTPDTSNDTVKLPPVYLRGRLTAGHDTLLLKSEGSYKKATSLIRILLFTNSTTQAPVPSKPSFRHCGTRETSPDLFVVFIQHSHIPGKHTHTHTQTTKSLKEDQASFHQLLSQCWSQFQDIG